MTDEQFSIDVDIKRVVVRDLSFETPMGQGVYALDWKPVYSWNMDLSNNRVADNLWEVILAATITAKLETNTAFLLEVQQAGVVEVADLEGDHLRRVLAIETPKLIFPYLRETVDNVAVKGGFPPICLRPPDFDALYESANPPEASSDAGQ